MRRFAILALLLPSVALAQPGSNSPPAPAGAPAPVGQPASTPGLPSSYAPAPRSPSQGYYPQPVPAPNLHTGVTFEANLGIGLALAIKSFEGESQSVGTDAGISGVDLGVGGWLSPKLALTARAAGVQVPNAYSSESSDRAAHYFIGPSLQYWVDNHFWLGGGLGVSTLFAISRSREGSTGPDIWGVGADLRAGYTVTSGTRSSVNISIEANTGFYSIDKGLGTSLFLTATGLALLIGYQYL